MKGRRVAVTGLGIVSPVGNSLASAWESLSRGKSGVGRVSKFDPQEFPSQIAGEVSKFEDAPGISAKEARRTDLYIRYGAAAAAQALDDAKFGDGGFDPERAGTSIGSGIGGLPFIEQAHSVLEEKGARRVSPFFIPSAIINMASGWVSMLNDLRGPNLAMATACTTGTHGIGEGARLIAYGDADIMLAGGTEGAISPLSLAGFGAARALSTRNHDPQGASRPFETERDGFVISEGAGVLVLEELGHAKARGAKIYCELVGYGMSGDAHHITAPPANGRGARLAMAAALRDAQASPEDLDNVNAHGTSTPLGDIAETLAIRDVFGSHADNLTVSATKSMTGHLLGAAGGIEAVFTVLSIDKQAVPPTINLDKPGDGCDLDYVAEGVARSAKIRAAISNSFGFGGTNGALIFARH